MTQEALNNVRKEFEYCVPGGKRASYPIFVLRRVKDRSFSRIFLGGTTTLSLRSEIELYAKLRLKITETLFRSNIYTYTYMYACVYDITIF